jgi:hypothetical protein
VNEPQTRWNPWFLKTLAAEAHLMIGNNGAAITAAREALMLMPRKRDTLRSRYARAVAARVFAWAGAEDEAVTLLEQLAILKPGLLPAEITRDPLYFIPLTESSRYRAFAECLEVQIENYDAEFRSFASCTSTASRASGRVGNPPNPRTRDLTGQPAPSPAGIIGRPADRVSAIRSTFVRCDDIDRGRA